MDTKRLLHDYIAYFESVCPENWVNAIPDSEAEAFLLDNIPRISIPDKQMERTYYFRLWTYRKHIRATQDGYVVTEFLPPVPWAGADNAISCPAGHHIQEGRWLADRRYLRAYIRHYTLGRGAERDLFSYSNSFLDAAVRFLIDGGERELAAELYPALLRQYERCKERHATPCGLYYSIDDRDGMEFSISGNGLRPTINSYLYGAALALSELSELLGDGARAEALRVEAAALGTRIRQYLRDPADGFYKTVPLDSPEGTPDFARRDASRNCREQIGYLPFLYGIPHPDEASVFRLLFDESCFAAPYGPTTADRAHPRFMANTVKHECLWDGPSWPFATSQTLSAMIRLAHEGTEAFTRAEFMQLLATYSRSHRLATPEGEIPFIDEDLDPFDGSWLARDLQKKWGIEQVQDRGMYYNHSTFADLVLSGALGIRVTARELSVHPLAIGTWDTFTVEAIPAAGRRFSLTYDRQTGLTLWEAGHPVATGTESLSYPLGGTWG